jgi:two-component system, NarL family, invasion response regulator UvrY
MKILLADDHAVVRQGYRTLLETMLSPVTIVEADCGTDAALLFYKEQPDVLVLDINMPDLSGIEVTRRILGTHPQTRILVFSMYEEVGIIREALDAGALGYLSKSSPPPLMIDAVRKVAAGETFLEAALSERLSNSRFSTGAVRGFGSKPLDWLAPREREIADLLVQGFGNQAIAEQLGISAKTVANRATVIRQKLGVGSTAEMVRKLYDGTGIS